MKKTIILLVLLFSVLAPSTYAIIGVGIGTGKIRVDDKLKPGMIYELPPLTVINTGDESSDYEVAAAYNESQAQLVPPESWFIFSPKKFHLEPGNVQVVAIKLNLPLRVEPGDYFVYLEGHPAKKSKTGTTSVGVAAAAKLYFTVVPANIFAGIYYKVITFWKIYSPWTDRTAAALGFILLLIIFKKFFNIQINLKNTSQKKKDE
jgi:hypothetical protein